MRATRVLLTILFLLIASTIGAQTWPNFGGTYFSGEEDIQLTLVFHASAWSMPRIDGSYWDVTVVGDGATVELCKHAIYYADDVIMFDAGVCSTLTWDPAAHAYVDLGVLHMGYQDSAALVFKPFEVRLIEWRVQVTDGLYLFYWPPMWVWESPPVPTLKDREQRGELQ